MANDKKLGFTFSIPTPKTKKEVLEFHKRNLSEYLFPRTIEDIEELIDQQSIFQITDSEGNIVGLSYLILSHEEDGKTDRMEFGGVYVLDEYRGYGFATALGCLSITQYFVTYRPDCRLIAHVHEFNDAPIGLLENQLGFKREGEEVLEGPSIPPNMKTNEDGKVVGHLYVFDKANLNIYLKYLKNFNGNVSGKAAQNVVIDVRLMIIKDKHGAIKSLEAMLK